MFRVLRDDQGQGLKELDARNLLEAWKDHGRVLWIDLDSPTPEEIQLLGNVTGFHPLALEDAVSPDQVPKVEEFDDALFLVFRSLRRGESGRVEEHHLAAFLGDTFLVTIHQTPIPALAAVATIALGRDVVWERSPDRILHAIVDRMTDALLPVLESFEEVYENLEEAIFAAGEPEILQETLALKRELFRIRRLLHPQREMLVRLGRLDLPHVDPRTAVYFRDVADHTARAEDLAVTLTELASQSAEAYLSVVSNRLNEVMKVLTVFSVTMMPLTFIVGVYGMNLKGMPEMAWPWFYPVLWGVMIAFVGGLLLVFRKKRWI